MQTKTQTYSNLYNQSVSFFEIISDRENIKALIEDIKADKSISIEIERFIYQTNFYPELEAKLKHQRVELAQIDDYVERLKLNKRIQDTESELKNYKIGILETSSILYDLKEESLSEVKRSFFAGNLVDANRLLNSTGLVQAQSLLLQKLGIEQELEEVYEKLADNATEYQVKAQLTALNLEIINFVDRLQKAKEFFEKGRISVERSKKPDFIVNYFYNYGCFLRENNFFNQAIEIYQEVLETASEYPFRYLPTLADTLNNLGTLHRSNNELNQAEQAYQESLEIRKNLADIDPDMYLASVADSLNNLGVLHRSKNELALAEREQKESLKIYQRLFQKNPTMYLPNIALGWNNMGILNQAKNKLRDSEQNHLKSLKLYRELAKTNPDVYLHEVATNLSNLGALHIDFKNYTKSEQFLIESINIYEGLAEKNPAVYSSHLARTLSNLATLYSDKKELEKSEYHFQQALMINRALAERTPLVYSPDLASTLNNLGNLHRAKNELVQSEQAYLESLAIRRTLATENPSVYLPDLAITLYNLSILYLKSKPDQSISTGYAKEAISILEPFLKIAPNTQKLYKDANSILDQWGTGKKDNKIAKLFKRFF